MKKTKHGISQHPEAASGGLQDRKRDSSVSKKYLTPSEIESLRQEMDEAKDLIFSLMEQDKQRPW